MEWLVRITRPDDAAEHSLSNDGDLKKGVAAWQCLNLRDELVAFLQKPPLL